MLGPDYGALRSSRALPRDEDVEASDATGGVDRATFMLPRVDDVSPRGCAPQAPRRREGAGASWGAGRGGAVEGARWVSSWLCRTRAWAGC